MRSFLVGSAEAGDFGNCSGAFGYLMKKFQSSPCLVSCKF